MAQLADTSDLLDGDGKQCPFRTLSTVAAPQRAVWPGPGSPDIPTCHALDVLVCHTLVTSSLYSLPYADEKQWPLIHSTG